MRRIQVTNNFVSMANKEFETVDDYERYVTERLAKLTPEQRTAVAASMGERWYPAYAAFATTESWGDAAVLRKGLDAVWAHLRGTHLDAGERDRLTARVDEVTPHMDDFDDANEALSACVIVKDALRSCGKRDNTHEAHDAMISAFNAVAPDWFMDEDQQPRLWKQARVQKEVRKKLRLLEQIAAAVHFDAGTIDALRAGLTSPDMVGEVRPRPKPKGSTGRTNRELFEQYRRVIEGDTRRPRHRMDVTRNPGMLFAELIGAWGGRYTRRKQFIDGTYGQLADAHAQRALVARNKARDAAVPGSADWPDDTRRMLDMSYANRSAGFDARSPDDPHGYGPSLRRLWIEARRIGAATYVAIIDALDAWGQHHPAAWQIEDRRRKKTSPEAKAAAALGERLARAIAWDDAGDVEFPWSAQVDGARWRVRINDFPDEPMYSLEVDGEVVGDFHDWPVQWARRDIATGSGTTA
ncbi:MAG TPA: DUF416 family protein [Gemmatimonadaceae bacterium]|nr:DUF416 family protein [Gemmatimonadaceae bacterium]